MAESNQHLPSTDEPRSRKVPVTDSNPLRTRDSADQDFGEAFIHRRAPHIVLGRRLRPFSFWHVALLDYAESPFAGYGGKVDLAALDVAASICQLRHPQIPRSGFCDNLRALWLPLKYNRRFNLKIVSGRLAIEPSPFRRELNKFSAYQSEFFARPVYGANRETRPIHVPWFFYEVSLLKRFNRELTWSECWDTPIGEGSWKNIGILEASGVEVNILLPAERAAARETRTVRKPSAKLLARIEEVNARPRR